MVLLYLVGACLLFAGLWLAVAKPWRTPVAVVDARSNGRRVNGVSWFGNYYPAGAQEQRPGILVVGGSEGGLHDQVDREPAPSTGKDIRFWRCPSFAVLGS